jgi:hypothetical protein
MMDKDAITKEAFSEYNRIRVSGFTNMLDIKTVTLMSDLSREECYCIMEHYKYLYDKYKTTEVKDNETRNK